MFSHNQECSTVVSKDEGDFVDAAIHQQEETLQQNSGKDDKIHCLINFVQFGFYTYRLSFLSKSKVIG